MKKSFALALLQLPLILSSCTLAPESVDPLVPAFKDYFGARVKYEHIYSEVGDYTPYLVMPETFSYYGCCVAWLDTYPYFFIEDYLFEWDGEFISIVLFDGESLTYNRGCLRKRGTFRGRLGPNPSGAPRLALGKVWNRGDIRKPLQLRGQPPLLPQRHLLRGGRRGLQRRLAFKLIPQSIQTSP